MTPLSTRWFRHRLRNVLAFARNFWPRVLLNRKILPRALVRALFARLCRKFQNPNSSLYDAYIYIYWMRCFSRTGSTSTVESEPTFGIFFENVVSVIQFEMAHMDRQLASSHVVEQILPRSIVQRFSQSHMFRVGPRSYLKHAILLAYIDANNNACLSPLCIALFPHDRFER